MSLYRDIEDVGKAFTDIILLTKLTLYGNLIYFDRTPSFRLDSVLKRFIKMDKPIYIRIRGKGIEVHILTYLNVIVCCSARVSGKWITGFSVLGNIEGTECLIYAYEIPLDILPRNINEVLNKIKKEIESIKPPLAWIGKELYGFKLSKLVNPDDPLYYIFLGERRGSNYLVKILRELSLNNRPLALNKSLNFMSMMLRNTISFLRITSMDEHEFSRILERKEVSTELAKDIFTAKGNLERILGFIIPKDSYDNITEYINLPPVIISEFIDGIPLSRASKTVKNMSISFVKRVMTELTTSISYLHVLGYVHGNISPDNIMLTTKKGKLGIKVINSLTVSEGDNSVIINLGYIDPQTIVSNGWYTARSDVYSLGMLMYYTLTSKPLFTRLALNYVIAKRFSVSALIDEPERYITQEVSNYVRELSEVVDSLAFKDVEGDMKIIGDVLAKEEKNLLSQVEVKEYRSIIKKCLSLTTVDRYKNAIEILNDLTLIK